MNKFQKELEKTFNNNNRLIEDELFKIYQNMAKELTEALKLDYDRIDDLTNSELMRLEKMQNLLPKIDEQVKLLGGTLTDEVTDYLIKAGHIGYNSVFYEYESVFGHIDFNMINYDAIKNVINTPVDNYLLSERLNDGVPNLLRNNLHNEISRSLVLGKGYGETALRLSEIAFSSYNRTVRIARTEGGRVSSITRQQSQNHAKSLGIELKKQWVSVLDSRTRHTHQELDGVQIDIDKRFQINGNTTMQPRMFGIASEDINCRCTTISVLDKYNQPMLRRDNETKEVGEWKNYNEWLHYRQNSV